MKNKKILLMIPALFLFSILFLSFIVAQPTLVTPASSATVTGAAYKLNVTNGSMIEIRNCTWYAKSASTANSSYVNITGLEANVTASASNISITFDSRILEDSNDYSIYATCGNWTLIQNTSVATGITINNTVPTVPSSLSPASESKDTDGAVTFSATVNGARTTSCTLYFVGRNPGSPSYTMTHTGNTCSRALTGILEETYDYYILASDSSETVPSTQTRFSVELPDGSSGYLFNNQKAKEAATENTEGSFFVDANGNVKGLPIVILAILLIVIVVAIVNRKK